MWKSVSGFKGITLTERENRVMKRTFGPKRDELTRDWKKLHNQELHNLYFLKILN
jgi:hypothetical protein